ncbi:hypothetical protein K8S19_00045 [bacterium]|nr:hypothetical protein [bacterium]
MKLLPFRILSFGSSRDQLFDQAPVGNGRDHSLLAVETCVHCFTPVLQRGFIVPARTQWAACPAYLSGACRMPGKPVDFY